MVHLFNCEIFPNLIKNKFMFLLNYYVVWGQLGLYPMPIIILICCCVCPYELVLKLDVLACKMLR